jgi:hypothetical protein
MLATLEERRAAAAASPRDSRLALASGNPSSSTGQWTSRPSPPNRSKPTNGGGGSPRLSPRAGLSSSSSSPRGKATPPVTPTGWASDADADERQIQDALTIAADSAASATSSQQHHHQQAQIVSNGSEALEFATRRALELAAKNDVLHRTAAELTAEVFRLKQRLAAPPRASAAPSGSAES